MISLFAQVVYWVGAYNIVDLYIWPPDNPDDTSGDSGQAVYDVVCLLLGIAALWITQTLLGTAGVSQDNDEDAEDTIDHLPVEQQIRLYLRGLVALLAAVVFWKGACRLLDDFVAPEHWGKCSVFFHGSLHLLNPLCSYVLRL